MVDKERIRKGYNRMRTVMDRKSAVSGPNKDELQETLTKATVEIVTLKHKLKNRDQEVEVLRQQVEALTSEGKAVVPIEIEGAFNYLKETLNKVANVLNIIQVNEGTLGIGFMIEHNDSIIRGIDTLEKLVRFSGTEAITSQSQPAVEQEWPVTVKESESEQENSVVNDGEGSIEG